jgi:hypothetical protein
MEEQMKKCGFNLILAAVLSLAIAGSAYAFSFDFHGSMLNIVAATDNANTLGNQQQSSTTDAFSYPGSVFNKWATVFEDGGSVDYAKTKARLRFEGTTDDGKAKFVYGLEVGGHYWGDTDFDLSGDPKDVETRFAYAQISSLGGKITAGLQGAGLNKWVWTETAPGLKYQTNVGDWEIDGAWFRGYNGFASGSGRHDNDDLFFVKANGKINQNLSLGLFGLYDNLTKEKSYASNYTAQYYWLGLTGKFKSGSIFGDFDAIYNGGDMTFDPGSGVADMDRSGYLGNLTVGFKINDQFKISLNGLYVSGDDDPNDNSADNFDVIDVDIKCGIVLFTGDSLTGSADNFVSDAPFINDKGLINIALEGEYQINDQNNVRVAVRKLNTAEDLKYRTDVGKTPDNDIGWEYDFWYTYKFNKNVSFAAEAGYLATGDGADHLTSTGEAESGMYQVAGGIIFKF